MGANGGGRVEDSYEENENYYYVHYLSGVSSPYEEIWLLHLMGNLKWNVSVRLHEHDILDDLAQLHL